jgi:hypothetical protein
MPGTTPTQGFPYPLATDRPCDYPATMQALATALDTKFQSFDTDAARLISRKRVKISRTGIPTFTFDTSLGPPPFDTVEYNVGTPTDLTLDPYSMQLAAGFYLLEGKFITPTSGAANDGFWHLRFLSTPSTVVTQGRTTARDFGSAFSPLTVTWMDLAYVASGTAKVTMSVIPAGVSNVFTADYVSMSAWWMADA